LCWLCGVGALIFTFPFESEARCPSGAVQGLNDGDCYMYRTSSDSSWYSAEEDCASQLGHLASVQNAFQNVFLPRQACSTCSSSGSTDYWIGASKGALGGTDWTWSDGTKFSYTNWAKGNYSSASTECGALNVLTAKWYQLDCGTYLPYICKVPSVVEDLPTCPSPTCPEPPACSTCPNVETCETGWTYYAPAQMCYQRIYNVAFYPAMAQCEAMGSQLASVHSDQQNDFLTAFGAQNLGKRSATWIGLYDPQHILNYQWTDGSPMDYANWAPGQPDDWKGMEHCAAILTDGTWQEWENSQWDDTACNATQYTAICQKPAN
jgi:hypothetical protein